MHMCLSTRLRSRGGHEHPIILWHKELHKCGCSRLTSPEGRRLMCTPSRLQRGAMARTQPNRHQNLPDAPGDTRPTIRVTNSLRHYLCPGPDASPPTSLASRNILAHHPKPPRPARGAYAYSFLRLRPQVQGPDLHHPRSLSTPYPSFSVPSVRYSTHSVSGRGTMD